MNKRLKQISLFATALVLLLGLFISKTTNTFADGEEDITAHITLNCATAESEECYNAAFRINGNEAAGLAPDQAELEYHYTGSTTAETITLRVESLWIYKLIGTITINDVPYVVSEYIDYDDEESWLNHYSHQTVGIDLEVQKSPTNTYNIILDAEETHTSYIGNFLWTADPDQEFLRNPETGEYILDENGQKIRGHDYIGHSSLALVAVSYELGGHRYSCNYDDGTCSIEEIATGNLLLDCDLAEDDSCGIPYVEFETDESLEYDDGSLVVPASARVTMRVIPDYGYQVLNVNMSDLETDENGIGEFTFTVPAGAAYFVADVVKMSDEFETDSDKISSGALDLGNQTTLDHGTARLKVEDVELNDETKEKFSEIASEDGYEIKNYLDISLYNITYKGTTDDAWEERVRDLNEPATVTLQLEDGVDGNEIVIVHEKHDGTYEVIPTTYDPVANTITFTTSSFSNYAIASRTVADSKTVSAADTGRLTVEEPTNSSLSFLAPVLAGISITLLAATFLVIKRHITKFES